jgi:hypothetical protein
LFRSEAELLFDVVRLVRILLEEPIGYTYFLVCSDRDVVNLTAYRFLGFVVDEEY